MYTNSFALLSGAGRLARLALAALLAASVFFGLGAMAPAAASTQVDLHGPAGSGAFGRVTVLPNGNFVVVDPVYSAPGPIAGVGAAYLYNGASGALISTLTGSTAGDNIGSGGVTVLANGNYVVVSSSWDNGPWVDAGAATWGSATTGVSGVVSAANSLVGSHAGNQVGNHGVTVLSNGNYLVLSIGRDSVGSLNDTGAVTWGSGVTGVSGVLSATNSLVGSLVRDNVGFYGVTLLTNGNYVVGSPHWGMGYGAATWGSGTSGVSGVISAANSLLGANFIDHVGTNIVPLSNGNYVVAVLSWHNAALAAVGAVTWANGTTGISGAISAANSLVGSTNWDQIANGGVTALSNGNYVVVSPTWTDGSTLNVGAVTWGSGATGITGPVSAANSLVGSTVGDNVGYGGVTALTNGSYVVESPQWHNGSEAGAGAVTWGSGAAGITGAVSPANSLVGATSASQVAAICSPRPHCVTPLSNGNYVVASPYWDHGGVVNAGAVTWGSGASGVSGVVSAANSLVGTTADDQVGSPLCQGGVTALSNGSYVVGSCLWHNGGVAYAGAATWGSGTTGITGAVTAANSLVGTADYLTVGSQVTPLSNGNYVVTNGNSVTWGSGTTGISGAVSPANSLVGSTPFANFSATSVTALANGNYVVASYQWRNNAIDFAGAVTWGSGASGVSGAVSPGNSLVGTTAQDRVGASVIALSNGNYLVASWWNANGAAANAGAVTWGDGTQGVSGAVTAVNSLVGSTADDDVGVVGEVRALSGGSYAVLSPDWDNGLTPNAGAVTFGLGAACSLGQTTGPISAANSVRGAASGGSALNFGYDPVHHQLVVGRPADNTVSLFPSLCADHQIMLPVILK